MTFYLFSFLIADSVFENLKPLSEARSETMALFLDVKGSDGRGSQVRIQCNDAFGLIKWFSYHVQQ